MGQAILNTIRGQKQETERQESELFRLVAGIDSNVDGTEDYPAFQQLDQCNVEADVLIDFSHHTSVPGVVEYCVQKNLPVVIATTGLDGRGKEALAQASEQIPVFHSANMSVGINTIAKLMETLIPAIEKDFNIEIIEKHHVMKKDSPSGTALLLANAINDACETKKDFLYGRHSTSDECKITDLGIHAVRGGTIPGEHTILLAGPDEIIEIKHTALSRTIFANGALRAAAFMQNREKGLYSMADVISGR
jgi:4-hydroxy-tetrahydrodipicolinate reductase